MNKTTVKWLILVGLTAWSLSIVWPPQEKVKLGLDLKGGTSFTVEIDRERIREQIREETPDITGETLRERVNEAADKAQDNAVEVIRNRVDGLGIEEPIIYATTHEGRERIVVQLPGVDEEKRRAARQAIMSVAFLEFRLVHERSSEWTQELFEEGLAPPGFQISQTGDVYARDFESVPDAEMDQDYYERLRKWQYKPGCEFMLEENETRDGNTVYRPYYVEVRRQLTGEAVVDADVAYHQVTRAPRVTLELDGEGTKRFARITRDYAPRGPKNPNSDVGRLLAIVLDDTLYSAPRINEEILGGRAEITGQFSVPEAMRLANVLQAGSLPAPVNIVETRSVDPTLGKDSIDSGMRALLYGAIAVVLFVLLYYRLAGIVANAALVLDMLLLPLGMVIASGFLGLFTGAPGGGGAQLPTLTLPGIAGIVLTIGMAVDANVLIFERIREEQRAGKTFAHAVTAGYDKVFSTIFDANITTLITAVILFWQGSGPIRGFAVTLSAGIIVSMYTALVVTRMFFDWLARGGRVEKLRMLRIVQDTKIRFTDKRFVALALSAILIVATWGVFMYRGADNFGVDFTGGTSLAFRYDDRQSVDDVRETLEKAGVEGAFIQYHQELGAGDDEGIDEFLEIKVGFDEGATARDTIEQTYDTAGYTLIKEDSVGPQVGEELRKKGVWAIVTALIGIVIYISFRFEFAFAIGAIAALVHDVLITVGVYCLLGNQLSLPIVAALLTIVGYSVNDTIVVFDRIREDLSLIKGKPYSEIANLSINQTLSRTLLTSITTLLSVVMLLILGGGAIHEFAIALFIGILVGTYSSIFVATPVMLLWHKDPAPAAEKTGKPKKS